MLLATVAMVPFATPPPSLVDLGKDESQYNETIVDLWFHTRKVTDHTKGYRHAYAASWSLCLAFNVGVVFLCTMLYLALPHMTQVCSPYSF